MNRIGYIMIFFLCLTVRDLWAQANYLIEPLSLNSNFNNEIFAISYEDGIVYCSDRRTHVLINRVDSTNHPLFHLFYVSKRDSNKWGIPHLLSKSIPINTHKWSCSISANGQEIYFTINDETGQRIFLANKSGDNWTNIRPFVHNRPNYTTTHPSVSPNGKRLFFASDMPGGFGGFDIYVCDWTPRGWGTPQNLGSQVNTTENELYPFIQGNGELFFSSTAHGSMGGMDIFSVREVNGVWGLPLRMEEPVNSIADDISYTADDADGTNGYVASNRDGKTFGLFSFKSLFPAFPDCQEQEENDYTYEFEDVLAVSLGDTATLKYMWDLGDGTIKYGEFVEHTYASTGVYEYSLSLIDSLTNEINTHIANYVLEVLDIEQPYIMVSDTLDAGTSAIFDASKTYLPDLDIEEYYWMFGDGTRKKGIHAEHIYALPGVYKVQLGVIGRSKDTGEKVKICTFRKITVH